MSIKFVANREIEVLTLIVHVKSNQQGAEEFALDFRTVHVCPDNFPFFEALTPRELEVLCLVAMGKTNKAIARKLVIVESTVEAHVRHIFDKLRVSDRTLAVVLALLYRIISIHLEI